MYAVLGNFTAEVFPTRSRGTGSALVSLFSRVAGVTVSIMNQLRAVDLISIHLIQGPLIALYLDIITATPTYIGGALTLLAGLLVLMVPCESQCMDFR